MFQCLEGSVLQRLEGNVFCLNTRRRRVPDPRHQEGTLVNVYSILQSAAATAYEHADNQTGSNRKVAMGVVHLIELAQLKMDSVLDEQPINSSS
ncbi:hypothetical protein NUH87_06285 [Pseudomonas batumici]|uniref:DUF6124 family protein n=1 Tax=Pseudomonas batumici TaxID=226910 RepID=UPI0030D1A680